MPQPDKSVLDIDLEVRFTDVRYAGGREIASGSR
jgi:hypothetical protein